MKTIFQIIILLIIIINPTFGQSKTLYKFLDSDFKYGFMDKYGDIKIQSKYLIVSDFKEGLAFVSKELIEKGYKWICIDTLGNEVFNLKDNFPETDFNQGFARVSSFTEHWFINRKGNMVFAKTFQDGQGGFENGYAKVSDEPFKNFYFIDIKGNKVEKLKIDIVNKESENSSNLISFEEDGKFGFKNKNGEIIIEAKFYKVDKFENGICAVRINERLFETANNYYLDAIINEKGEILNQIPMHCYLGFRGELIEFYEGLHFSGKVLYLNKEGKLVTPKE